MKDELWLEELARMEKEDPWRQECLARVNGLTAACEELEHASVFLAYALGRRQI